MEVEVIRSARRRKTVQAVVRNGVLRLSIPASMTTAEERHWAAVMLERIERKHRSATVDLVRRARELAARYDLPVPESIVWSHNQQARWGSCTPATGAIRISSRLAGFPAWVLDSVIVHELAHLVVLGHNAEFKALMGRYPLAERAHGFLIAKGYDACEPVGDPRSDAPAEAFGFG